MNFSELYTELLEVLAENSTPQYWSAAELKRYINRAVSELCKRARLNRFMLPLVQAELGAFHLPTDVLQLQRIYYCGKILDHKSPDFLDAHYGGTGHAQIKRGDGFTFSNNWRNETGTPIHWYYENGKIKLYPKPEAALTISTIRSKLTGTFATGAAGLTLAGSIPTDQNRVDLFIDGVYQNKDQWSITSATAISFTGWTAIIGGTYEVVYIGDNVSLSVIAASEKYIRYVSTGQSIVSVPGGYTPGVGALSVALNGVTQSSSAFTETATGYITLASAVLADSIVEITVTRTDPSLTASAIYTQKPVDMVNDADTPPIDQLDWQRGIVHYAAHLALTKEGKMTQDIQKSQIHLARFMEIVKDALTATAPEIDLSPEISMPFFV